MFSPRINSHRVPFPSGVGTSFGDVAPSPSRRETRKPLALLRLGNLGTEPDRAPLNDRIPDMDPRTPLLLLGLRETVSLAHVEANGADNERSCKARLSVQHWGEGESSSRLFPGGRGIPPAGGPPVLRGARKSLPHQVSRRNREQPMGRGTEAFLLLFRF